MLLLRPHDCCSPEAGDCVLGAPGSERALWGSDSAIVAAMRTRSLLLAIALGLGLPAAGCGSSSPGDPDGGTPGSADDFPARYATAWCAMSKRCCEGAGGTYDADCEAAVATEVMAHGTEAMADGATWDATTAGRCLDAIEAADCAETGVAELVAMVNTCSDTWTGVVPPGGACMTYGSCAEPAVSGGATAGASCVNSMCVQVVRQPAGAPCSDTTSGPLLTLCDPLEGVCTGGVCVALPGNGEACTGACRSGSRCTGGVCAALLAAGADCSAGSECASDACNGGRCASVLAASLDDHCTLP